MKKVKSVPLELRCKLYKHYYRLPESYLLEQLQLVPYEVERAVIERRWKAKKQFTRNEQIFKAWCNGDVRAKLAKEFKLSVVSISRAIVATRKQLIKEIQADIHNGLLVDFEPQPIKETSISDALQAWENALNCVKNA